MADLLEYSYMQRALVAGVLVGGLCALIGVYVVLKGLAFIGAGISHASLGGIALGVAAGVNPILSAFAFSVLVAWLIGVVSRRLSVREDTSIGIFFASAQALGVLIIGLMRDYQVDLLGYLFGSIVSVTPADVWIAGTVTLLIVLLVVILFKDLLFMVFDSEMATVTGVPASRLYFLLLTLIALTVVVAIKVVGIVLVSALVVTPAAAAYQLTESFRKMMAISVVFGVVSCVAGLILADVLRIAPGATIVMFVTVLFFSCALVSPRRRRKRASAS